MKQIKKLFKVIKLTRQIDIRVERDTRLIAARTIEPALVLAVKEIDQFTAIPAAETTPALGGDFFVGTAVCLFLLDIGFLLYLIHVLLTGKIAI